jgi:hypothetical protein
MRKTIASTALLAGLALGVAMSSSARAAPTQEEEQDPTSSAQPSPTMTPQSPVTQSVMAQMAAAQGEIAQATAALEEAFAKQFEQGMIEQEKLAGLIYRAVQAFPAAVRPTVQGHINRVVNAGKKLAPQMSPEQRKQAVTPPEKLGKTQQEQLAGWGWGNGVGFGGLGAFGFPGMWGGLGGLGAFPATSFYGPALGLYGGTGLGGGWGWPGYGGWGWGWGW